VSPTRVQQAVDEAVEARRPGTWFRAILLAITGISAGGLLLWVLGRARRRVSDWLSKLIVRAVGRVGLTDQHANRVIYLLDFLQRRTVNIVLVVLRLLVAYMLATFVLRQLPYTRPWGESLREFMLATLSELATNAVNTIPELFTIFIIVLVIRFVTKLLEPRFDAVERGAITVQLHASGNRTDHTPAGDDRALAVCRRPGVPVCARQQHRRVQGHQRVRRLDGDAGIERVRQS
jgi:hypothetical protein